MITNFKIFEDLRTMSSSQYEEKITWTNKILESIQIMHIGYSKNGYLLYECDNFIIGIEYSSLFGNFKLFKQNKNSKNSHMYDIPVGKDDIIYEIEFGKNMNVVAFFENISKTINECVKKDEMIKKANEFNL